jgi:hypothetical protein
MLFSDSQVKHIDATNTSLYKEIIDDEEIDLNEHESEENDGTSDRFGFVMESCISKCESSRRTRCPRTLENKEKQMKTLVNFPHEILAISYNECL